MTLFHCYFFYLTILMDMFPRTEKALNVICTFNALNPCYYYTLSFFNFTTTSTWLELMALMSYYFARLWKHISSIFGTIGRREHIQRFLTILRNFGMREPINGILNTSLLEIKGRLYRLLHIINEFSHLRIHSFPLINIPSYKPFLLCQVKWHAHKVIEVLPIQLPDLLI